tara:strand:+ start:162 stop:1094 length:933 start_codon:yes stop_codon:yes gene_type:complete
MSNSIKQPNEFKGYSNRLKDNLSNATERERLQLEGIANSKKIEPIPNFRKAPCEDIHVNGQNNCQIVTGRDRPAGLLSGYGGRGDTQSASIDIVVGRHISSEGVEDESGDKIYVDPNFEKDAARIHISQRTDIDNNFNISDGKVGNSIARSGIALKADAVRVIGREGIKLVTKTERLNSLDGEILRVKGIDLIAGNKGDQLQPLVKGANLVKYLNQVQDDLVAIVGMINSLATKQLALDAILASHVHLTAAGPTLPSLELAVAATTDSVGITSQDFPSHTNQLVDLAATKIEYLNSDGPKYILSKYNTTN